MYKIDRKYDAKKTLENIVNKKPWKLTEFVARVKDRAARLEFTRDRLWKVEINETSLEMDEIQDLVADLVEIVADCALDTMMDTVEARQEIANAIDTLRCSASILRERAGE